MFRAWFCVQTEQWVLVTQANELVRQHWTPQTVLTGKKNTTQNRTFSLVGKTKYNEGSKY